MRHFLFLALLLTLPLITMAQNGEQEGVKSSEVSQQLPSFPGGDQQLFKFIAANFKYPYIAEKEEIQGRVMVQFNVMPDGTITDVEVAESIHPSLDKEAIRVVKSMQRWIPGKDKDGKPVKVPFTMPVTFKLPNRFYSVKTHQLHMMAHFGQGESTINEKQSAPIKIVGAFMRQHPEDTLVIKGYTRMGLSTKQSQKLSEARAKAVKMELVKRYGIDANHIIANGMGATKDIASSMDATKVFDSIDALNDVVLFYLYEKNNSTNQVDANKQKEDDAERDIVIAQYDAIPPTPCFPDGPQAMSQYITDHLQYPESAKKDSIQGNVYVSFNVENEGTLTDIKVIRSVSPELDNEACRLVNSMPKWIPVMKDGAPTSARYILPVRFSLGDTNKQLGNLQSVKRTKTSKGGKTILPDSIDAMPSFPNGQQALFKFLSKNIKYPVKAEEKRIQGHVIIGFVVDVDGSLTDIKVIMHIDPLLDKEATRVVKNMPRWIPGKLDGIPVRVEYTLPITFRLQ